MQHVLLDSTAAGHLRLTYDTSTEAYTASLSDGVTTVTIVVLAETIPAEDGRFALRYDAARFELLFNGRSLGSVATPPLPVLAGSLSLGGDAAGNQWDDVVGGVRVSSRARSAAEILTAAGQSLALDADTAGLLIVSNDSARVLSNDGASVQLDCPPIRPASKKRDNRQLRETDSTGAPVVYGKGDPLTLYGVTFPRLSTLTLASLFSWVANTVKGVRRAFTWIDHTGIAHDGARLTSSRVRATPAGPNQHRVELEIEVNE